MNEVAKFIWTFTQEIKPEKVTQHVKDILLDSESIEACYKTIRDSAIITDKRIIIADKQGLTGKKVEVYTIPFKSINMYSSENSPGILDINSELEFWTRAGHFKLNLKKGIDIRKLDKLIAKAIL